MSWPILFLGGEESAPLDSKIDDKEIELKIHTSTMICILKIIYKQKIVYLGGIWHMHYMDKKLVNFHPTSMFEYMIKYLN